ncbi:tetratricopeptide repeat protein [Streptomyces sp. NBC_00554]|uniref:tetratricopeptide repeat protein n=1 Tax=Streptomyces sp. NBC_00554 TaxID=2903661 RepID=UPI00352E6EBC|nr:tetratricopeptide repeat protein [Streptomyces sp. NBC_00554]
MTQPEPTPAQTVQAIGHRSATTTTNRGIISTGDGASIDARTQVLPADAYRLPTQVDPPPGLTNLPAPASDVFVGREEDLNRLETAVADGAGVVTQVMHGLGGVGKTTLALHYAHRHLSDYTILWWINADSPNGITTALTDLAARLNPRADFTTTASDQAVPWALTWLQSHTGWLLIFDNATAPETVAPYIGQLRTGRHLITTRLAHGWHRLARPVPLDTLTPAAAIDLLARITAYSAEHPALADIAADLGYLPLALEHAAAYVRHAALTPATYLDRLRRYPARMFAASPAGGEQERTIARIWHLTLAAITEQNPLAADLLRTLAWFAPEHVPRDLLSPLHDDPIAVDEALGLLAAYSMITITETTVSTHRLVQTVARTPEPTDPQRAPDPINRANRQATIALRDALPDDPEGNPADWPRWRELLPHIDALASATDPLLAETEATGYVLHRTALFLQGHGQTARAITYLQRAEQIRQRVLGEEHPDTLATRNNLAGAYQSAGNLRRAITLYEQTLTDRVRLLGEEHADTLATRNDLAGAYQSAGDLRRAITLYEQTLTDRVRLLGEEHADTLATRNDLAVAYQSAGDLRRAITLYEQTLTDRVRLLGEEHPHTLTTRNDLAGAYHAAGNLRRAITLYEQTLTDEVRLLGEEHPDTLITRNNLAVAYHAAGNLRRAITLYEQTLTDEVRLLGEEHPHTLTTRNNLAGAYQSAGDLQRAITLYEQTLTDSVRLLGGEHPDTLTTRNNLAGAYQSAGDLRRAITLYEQTLTDRVRLLGGEHPDTLATRNDLAGAYESAGDLQRAITLYEQTLTDRVRLLGGEHPHTLTSRNDLAGAYESAGDLQRAITLYEQTLTDQVRLLGEEHPHTLTTRNNLAGAYHAAGDLGRAIPLYEQNLTDRVRLHSENHPETLTSRSNLAYAYESAGDLGRAITLYEQTLTDQVRLHSENHPETLTSRSNLAYAYESAGDLGRAITLYEQNLTDQVRLLGNDHPDTRASRQKLACWLWAMGDEAGAEVALEEAFRGMRMKFTGVASIVLPVLPGWEDRSQAILVQSEQEDGFAPNIVVTHEARHGRSLDQFLTQHLSTLEQTFNHLDIGRNEPATFGAHSGHLIDYTFLTNDKQYRQAQFFLFTGKSVITFTVSHTSRRFPAFWPVMKRIIEAARIESNDPDVDDSLRAIGDAS